ncbi:MAG: DNA repair and recombination protein RadB, partial [Methanobrevibacter sp.]|nr:DNA repair and recombination protein RadB [Methanobrevibacter sp.]
MKILSAMENQEKLSTNSPLDELLGGGIDKRTITQIYGPPGVGKTNVALNISVNVAKEGKKVIYIDTEGGISVERIKQISGDDFEIVAKNIIVFEPTSFKEQEDDLNLIEEWLDSNDGEVELIVLDSAVALFRVEEDKSKSHLLGKQMQQLSTFAINHDLAVLVTNQIYASFDEGSDEMAPVGGTIIQYRSKIIIELKREEGTSQRIALLKRHKTRREGLAIHFSITN